MPEVMGNETDCSAAPRLEIRLLGNLQVVHAGRVLPLPASRKTRALLAYLVATRKSHLRANLCDLLWQGPADPRAELRWSLTKIRPVLDAGGTTRLVANRDRVAFSDVEVDCDLLRVRDALARGLASGDVEALRAACDVAREDALEGLDLPDQHRFYQWWMAEREGLRALRVAALRAMIRRTREPADTLVYARRWMAIDPLSREAHDLVVRLLRDSGRSHDAMQQVRASRALFAPELAAAR